jgi:hypothetical protein
MVHVDPTTRLDSLIDNYMSSRRRPSVVSTTAAARALTTLMTACPLTGRALEDAIAASAVRHGHAVAFDLAEARALRARRAPTSGPATRLVIRYQPD